MDNSSPQVKRLPLRLLQGVTIYWLALKVIALFAGEPHADEAYYWMWGQHLALSYVDHAPLHAWLQGLVSVIFGWNLFSLRFLSIVSAGVVLFILYLWSRRLAGEDWKHRFWLSAALFYSTPLMLLYTTIALHDRVLVACVLVSMHFFSWFFADWAEGRRDRYAALYLGALFLGLATLTKYNGALLGVGVGLAVLMRRDLRSLLTSPHLYLAAMLSVAIQAPVIYWNLTQGLATFSHHLAWRPILPDLANLNIAGTTTMLLVSLVVLSPIAVWGMAVFVVAPGRQGLEGVIHSVGRWTFIASTAFFILLSLGSNTLFYWNIVAYAAFFAVAASFLRSRILQLLQFIYGAVVCTILIVHLTVFPVLPMLGIYEPSSNGLFGWDQLATEVRAAEAEVGTQFVASPTWGVATRLAFALGDPDIAALTPGTDAFDFWFDDAAHRGMDAIVVAEPNDDTELAQLAAQFESLEPLRVVTTQHFGQPMSAYEFYVARNYLPQGE